MRPSNNLENKIPSDAYWRVQLVCKKVQAYSSLESPLIHSGSDAFDESSFVMTFLTIFKVTEILRSFRLVLEGKSGKESSILEFLEMFLANNFASSDAENN